MGAFTIALTLTILVVITMAVTLPLVAWIRHQATRRNVGVVTVQGLAPSPPPSVSTPAPTTIIASTDTSIVVRPWWRSRRSVVAMVVLLLCATLAILLFNDLRQGLTNLGRYGWTTAQELSFATALLLVISGGGLLAYGYYIYRGTRDLLEDKEVKEPRKRAAKRHWIALVVITAALLWFGFPNMIRLFTVAQGGSQDGLAWVLQPREINLPDVPEEIHVPNVEIPRIAMPDVIAGLSLLELAIGGLLLLVGWKLLGRTKLQLSNRVIWWLLLIGGLWFLLGSSLSSDLIVAARDAVQDLGRAILTGNFDEVRSNHIAVALLGLLALAFLVWFLGAWLGIGALLAFLLGLHLFPSFGPTVMGTVERVRQGDAASVYADGTGSQDLLPGQTAEPVVHDPGHAASVRINARECRSGLTDAAIMFPRESGWHIDMSSLAPRHDVLVWKYTPATGWHYYNFREFGQLEAEGTGNADGEMYKVCRFPGGDPIVLVTFLKV